MLGELYDLDTEEIANKLVEVTEQKRELAEQEDQLRKELANRLIDREPDVGKMYIIAGRRFTLSRPNKKEKWDVDHLKNDLYKHAVLGTFHKDPLGELHGEPESRLYEIFNQVFTMTPKKTPLKNWGLDVSEYCETLEPGELKAQLYKE